MPAAIDVRACVCVCVSVWVCVLCVCCVCVCFVVVVVWAGIELRPNALFAGPAPAASTAAAQARAEPDAELFQQYQQFQQFQDFLHLTEQGQPMLMSNQKGFHQLQQLEQQGQALTLITWKGGAARPIAASSMGVSTSSTTASASTLAPSRAFILGSWVAGDTHSLCACGFH